MSEPAFFAALAAFQDEMPDVGKAQTAEVKTKSGGSYSYSFADLADVTRAVAPLLTKHGLAWSARPMMTEAGFVLRYSLTHNEGHRETGDYPLPDPSQHSPQEIGSAITYARRYALTALTGVAPSGEDDDGEKATRARAARQTDAALTAPDPVSGMRAQIAHVGQMAGWTVEKIAEEFATRTNVPIGEADLETLTWFFGVVDEERKRGAREHARLVADTTESTQAGTLRKKGPDAGRVERSGAAPDDEFVGEPA